MPALSFWQIVTAIGKTRFPGTTEYAFRHALLRDSAYTMLTPQGRQAAHSAAAAWLERVGETDPLAIALHHEQAGDRAAAAPWLLQAAEREFINAGSVDRVIELCNRGLVEGLPPDVNVKLRRVRVAVLGNSGRWVEATPDARDLMHVCEPGSMPWLAAAAVLTMAAQNGDLSGLPKVVAGLSSMRTQPVASRDWGFVACTLMAVFAEFGQREMVALVKARLDGTPVDGDVAPSFLGYKLLANAHFSNLSYDPAGLFYSAREAVRYFEEARDESGLLTARSFYLPAAFAFTGHYAAAQQTAEAAAATALTRGVDFAHDLAVGHVGHAASLTGDRAAPGRLRALLRTPAINLQGYVFAYAIAAELAHAAVDLDRLAVAEAEARASLEGGPVLPRARGWVQAFLALAAVARGAWSEALVLADSVVAEDAMGSLRTEALLARAEALHGLGRFEEARETIAGARKRLLAQVERFEGASDRAAYLARQFVARTLRLADEWLDDDASSVPAARPD